MYKRQHLTEIDKLSLINDNHNYLGEKIEKPWGYEYEIYSSNSLSIWILNIKEGQSTSFHCHPNKFTLLHVLSTETRVVCNDALTYHFLYKGDQVLIDKGAFHQTTACLAPAVVMEIESPNNKNDLIRFKDKYGRV